MTPLLALGLEAGSAALGALAPQQGPSASAARNKDKARAAAEEFEAVYLNNVFQSMFAGLDGDGPMGGDKDAGVWRSFMVDEFAKSYAKAGGIGIANDVYRTLLAQQEMRAP